MKQLYFNAKIYQKRATFADAMLISDGRVAAIGRYADICPTAQDYQAIDLQGKTVIPGLHDSHCHLLHLGEGLSTVRLAGCDSIAQLIARGKVFLQTHPNIKILLGNGWNHDLFTEDARLPVRQDLDEISTDLPIIFSRACGHICVANTKALALAKIDANTNALAGGVIYKAADGTPNGLFSENAMEQINAIVPQDSVEDMAAHLETAMRYCAQYGITSAQTADFRQSNVAQIDAAYKMVYRRNPDAIRTYQQCIFTDAAAYRAFVQAGYRTGVGDAMYKMGPLKLFVDGSLGARTAWMRQPYQDDTTTCGVLAMPAAQLAEMLAIANANQCQVAVHAIGDAAIAQVLNGYDAIISDKNNLRHGIIHCQITDLAQLQRFAQKDILAYLQPIFIDYDMKVVTERVGKELAQTSYQFGSLYRMGVHTAYGTDAPVEDANPYQNIYCAVTRTSLDGQMEYLPAQKVDIYDAIDQYTIGSAYMCFAEDEKGRLKEGYLADFVVLDTDIFTAAEGALQAIRPLQTVVGGRVVYTRAASAE